MIITNIWSILPLISITFIHYVTSVDIECNFKNDDFDAITNQYTCDVQNNLMINAKNVVIQAFRGSHIFGKASSDVTGLSILDRKIQYFPDNLGNKFKNLVAIKIRQGRLKEISQNDLKPFKKLRYLNLDANDIEALDDDLFEFNPQLEIIWFEGNRIKNTGESVFDNLNNLKDLDLNGNACISKRMSNSRGMPEFLALIKKNCFDADVELTKFKLKYKDLSVRNSNLLAASDVEIFENINADHPNAQMLISNKDDEIEELRIVVRNLTELMKTKENEAEEQLSKIQLEIIEKEVKVERFEEVTANITSEKNKLTNQLSKCQQKVQKLESGSENFTTELSQKTNQIKQLNSQLVDLQVSYALSLEEIANLTMENIQLSQSLNRTEGKLKDFKEIDIDSLPEELEERIKEYIKLDSQLKQREADLNKFEVQVASTISALTKSKEKFEKIVKHKNQEIVKKDSEIKRLKTQNAQYLSKNNQQRDQLKDIKSRSMSLERIVKANIVSLEELNKTKISLEIEKFKLQELEIKFNTTLENKTIECTKKIQQGLEIFSQTKNNSKIQNQNCPEQLENTQAVLKMKNNRIKGLLKENKQLVDEKDNLITRQEKLKELLNNKTNEWSQEVEKVIDLEDMNASKEAAIETLIAEKSQLKHEISILNDSEMRLKNSLNNKYGSCYNNIQKLNQDLKTSSHNENNLKEKIARLKNTIKIDNSTIINLIDEINELKNQTSMSRDTDSKLQDILSVKTIKCSEEVAKVQLELKNCTRIGDELRQRILYLEAYDEFIDDDTSTDVYPYFRRIS